MAIKSRYSTLKERFYVPIVSDKMVFFCNGELHEVSWRIYQIETKVYHIPEIGCGYFEFEEVLFIYSGSELDNFLQQYHKYLVYVKQEYSAEVLYNGKKIESKTFSTLEDAQKWIESFVEQKFMIRKENILSGRIRALLRGMGVEPDKLAVISCDKGLSSIYYWK